VPSKFPQIWTAEQLEVDRLRARSLFREERMREPLEEYLEKFEEASGAFEALLETTVDLTQVTDKAADIVADPKLLEALRYLAGPPVSADDLRVLADTTLARTQLLAHPDVALRIVDTIMIGLDRRRFPWFTPNEKREANDTERQSAVLSSAALLASQRVATMRRNASKTAQEQKVKDALVSVHFDPVRARKIDSLMSAPQPGQFCGESRLGSKKADIVAGLWDLRTLGIECKVSNSAINSIKRLNHDAVAKAKIWQDEFGKQVVSVAVLGGVYDLPNLQLAQSSGIFLFWAHDLEKLTDWIETTRP
jgi:hypothetical protein